MLKDLKRWQLALLSFSLPRNTGRILSFQTPRGNIGCLHGIRVLSLAWVILGHAILSLSYNSVIINKLDMLKLQSTLPFQIIINAPLAVDTFFFLSGFLTAYLFMKECGPKEKVSGKTMGLYYLHRYLRLTPPMMVWIMVVATLVKYVGEGRPAWIDYYPAKPCRAHWWTNLLYINSVYKDHDCVGVTWFLSHDMMFYIIAPLALVPFVYRINLLGMMVSALFIAVHVSSNLWIVAKYNTDLLRNSQVYNTKIYFEPYARIAPFAIGLIFGWTMWKNNGKVKMNKVIALLGWLLAIGLALTLTLVSYDDNNDWENIHTTGNWPRVGRVLMESLQRPLWALVIGWIVLACSSGYGGFINSILSWPGWLPLSRLSFGAYLTHITVMTLESSGAQSQTLFTYDILAYKFLGFYIMAYFTGFLLSLAVEMPTLGVERALFRRK